MSGVVDLERARQEKKVKKGFKNWTGLFKSRFGISTRMEDIPDKALAFLAEGSRNSSFYYYDLIMSLKDKGSGFGFNELDPSEKLNVIDMHLFLLDRIRYEYMKRLGWLDSYPGEENTLVELVMEFNELAPDIQARPAVLRQDHPRYREYISKNLFEKEELIRKLIPEALKKISL